MSSLRKKMFEHKKPDTHLKTVTIYKQSEKKNKLEKALKIHIIQIC